MAAFDDCHSIKSEVSTSHTVSKKKTPSSKHQHILLILVFSAFRGIYRLKKGKVFTCIAKMVFVELISVLKPYMSLKICKLHKPLYEEMENILQEVHEK